jgi:hypothetical protein
MKNSTKLMVALFCAGLTCNFSLADTEAPAPSAKDMAKAVEKTNYLETDTLGIKLSGYVDVGYIYNFSGNTNVNRVGSDGVAKGDFSVNTVKLALEKPLSDKNEWQAGFRTDLMLGKDAATLNDNGFNGNASEFYLQQAYVNFRVPVGNGLDITAGKFTSWLGYEELECPANINITYNMMYSFLPASMTGVAFEYPATNSLTFGVAIGNGMGDSNFGGLDSNDGYGMMAKIDYVCDNVEWQNAVYYSWDSAYEAAYGDDLNNNIVVIYDSLFTWTPKFANDKLLFGLNADLGYAEATNSGDGVLNGTSSTLWGAALYGKYQFTEIFSLAGRVAYLHVDDPDVFYTNSLGGSIFAQDTWSLTLTAGFNVVENFMIRAEYRVDVGNNTTENSGDIAHMAAVQAVYAF